MTPVKIALHVTPSPPHAKVARLFHRFTDYTITSTGTRYTATDTTTITTTTTTIASTTIASTVTATSSSDLQTAVQGRLQVRTFF